MCHVQAADARALARLALVSAGGEEFLYFAAFGLVTLSISNAWRRFARPPLSKKHMLKFLLQNFVALNFKRSDNLLIKLYTNCPVAENRTTVLLLENQEQPRATRKIQVAPAFHWLPSAVARIPSQ